MEKQSGKEPTPQTVFNKQEEFCNFKRPPEEWRGSEFHLEVFSHVKPAVGRAPVKFRFGNQQGLYLGELESAL